MKTFVSNNFSRIKVTYLYAPCILLFTIFVILFCFKIHNNEAYISCQKALFLYGNAQLAKFPQTMQNMTELGDGLIILSLLSYLFIYSPKCWETLLTSFIISGVLTIILKRLFSIQRPAAAFLEDQFVVLGPKLMGDNSFPSGHSITTFTILSVILFAFMPQYLKHRLLWCFGIFSLGLLIISTRIAVGAHHPLDIIVGSIIGYFSAVLGVLTNQRYKIWTWIANIKYYPIFISIFVVSTFIIIIRILDSNLFIFYLALLSLLISTFYSTKIYVKNRI